MRSLYDIKQLFYRIHGKSLFKEETSDEIDMFDALNDDEAAEKYHQQQIAKDIKQKYRNAQHAAKLAQKPKRTVIKNNSINKRLNSDNQNQRDSISMTSMQNAFAGKDTTFLAKPEYISTKAWQLVNGTFQKWVTDGFNRMDGKKVFSLLLNNIKRNEYLSYRLGTGADAITGYADYNDVDITSGKNSAKHIRFIYRPGVAGKTKNWNAAEQRAYRFEITPNDIAYALPLPLFGQPAFYIKLNRGFYPDNTVRPTDIFVGLANDSNKDFIGRGEQAKAFDNLVFFIGYIRTYCKAIGAKIGQTFMTKLDNLVKDIPNYAATEFNFRGLRVNWVEMMTYLANNIKDNPDLNLEKSPDRCAKMVAKHLVNYIHKSRIMNRQQKMRSKDLPYNGLGRHKYFTLPLI